MPGWYPEIEYDHFSSPFQFTVCNHLPVSFITKHYLHLNLCILFEVFNCLKTMSF